MTGWMAIGGLRVGSLAKFSAAWVTELSMCLAGWMAWWLACWKVEDAYFARKVGCQILRMVELSISLQ